MLNMPELVRQVLVDQSTAFEKTAAVHALGALIHGNGVFLSEGEQHRRARKLLAPHFQHNRVLYHAEIMTDRVSRLQATWEGGATINLANEMTRLTLWIISKVLFDADVSGEEREVGEILTYTFRHFADAVTPPPASILAHVPESNERAKPLSKRMRIRRR
ncbi:hypothetical protein KSF_066290 [Reticulibacter mediterranei]|uniref:Cytochrome P450 n=1 Tax=Reticulibacter mediterranei TaxID=2778369 RepID=A0A8J3IL87_9CHLR|nr:hypothetical protein KSF_066290 [Reticulibacter mediterranei]